jgi:soluble lytic murein transglycosylase-like protein
MAQILLTLYLGVLLLMSADAAADIYVRQAADEGIVLTNLPAAEGYQLLVAEAANAAPTGAATAPGTAVPLGPRARHYSAWVDEAARESRLEAPLLHAVIAAESGYDPAARSPKGAIGIMQLLPATARRYGVADSYDARQNIRGGARYLADLLRLFNNDKRLALAAYNAGEHSVLRHGGRVPPFRETLAYVPRVLANYQRLVGSTLAGAPGAVSVYGR